MINLTHLTVFTDASYCPHTNAAGGGCWSRTEEFRFSQGFGITNATNSTSAEIIAAAVGALFCIREATKAGEFFNSIIIVSDCAAVRNALFNPASEDHPEYGGYCHQLWTFLKQEKVRLKVNHVPAHRTDGSPRTWVNNHVDQLAYNHMTKLRKLRKRKQA